MAKLSSILHPFIILITFITHDAERKSFRIRSIMRMITKVFAKNDLHNSYIIIEQFHTSFDEKIP